MRYKKLNHTRFHPIGSVSLFFIIFFTWLTPSVFAAQGTTANDTTNQAKIIQNRVPNAPITFGQTITDTISLPGEQDSYTFTGSSGDTVRIRMLDLDGGTAFGPRIWLYRPDGALLCTSSSAYLLADVTCSLNASGVFTILVGDIDGNATATYSLSLLCIVCSAGVDLLMEKDDTADPVIINTPLRYDLRVTNNGSATATNVTVVDTLPAAVSFIEATSGQGTCAHANGIVTCDLGNLAATHEITISVAVTSTTTGVIVNEAVVTSSETDANFSDNVDTETTTIIGPSTEADLVLTMLDSPDPVRVNEPLTYTLTVLNAGPATATNVVLEDELPDHITFVSAAPTSGCTHNVDVVRCTWNALLSGQTVTAIIVVTPTHGQTIINTASVTANEHDPNPANNTSTATTLVCAHCVLGFLVCGSPLTGITLHATPAAPDFLVTWQQTTLDLALFYRVRDEILDKTPTGQQFIDLYYTHDAEILSLFMVDDDLREEGTAVINLWQSHLQALVNGQGETAVISASQVQGIEAFLNHLAAAGSAELQADITAQRAQIPLDTFVGMTMKEAEERLTGHTLYLPILLQHEEAQSTQHSRQTWTLFTWPLALLGLACLSSRKK